MSESDYDSTTEYTSLMDGHAEVRTDGLGSSVERRKRRTKVASNTEVILQLIYIFYFAPISIFIAENYLHL